MIRLPRPSPRLRRALRHGAAGSLAVWLLLRPGAGAEGVEFAIADWVILLIINVALTAISYALQPKPKNARPEPASFDDLDLPDAAPGEAIPRVWGEEEVVLRHLWSGDLQVIEIRSKGGKK